MLNLFDMLAAILIFLFVSSCKYLLANIKTQGKQF